MNDETALMQAIRAALVATGTVVLWRNNAGVARYRDRHGKTWPVRYGLGLGSADLVGFVIGSGRFFALEVKTPEGSLSRDQRTWRDVVVRNGGAYACVRSVEEAVAALVKARDAA